MKKLKGYKTYLAAIVTASPMFALLVSMIGLQMTAEEIAGLINSLHVLIAAIATFAGTIMTYYGRWDAGRK